MQLNLWLTCIHPFCRFSISQLHTCKHTHTDLLETVKAALDCRMWLMSCLTEPWSCNLLRYSSCTTHTYLIAFYKIVSVARKSHYCRSEPYTENTKWPYTRAVYVSVSAPLLRICTHCFSPLPCYSSSRPSLILTHAFTHTSTLRETNT